MQKISVIIPVYNVEKYLVSNINSLVTQTLDNLELIYIDDGSTDGSLEILTKYQEKYKNMKVIHQENSGVSVARNKGLAVATGDYIAFVDPDDCISKYMFEKLYSAINSTKADIVTCKFMTFTKVPKFKLSSNSRIYNKNDAIKMLLEGKELSNFLWDKLYKRNLFNDIKFREGKIFEDLDVMYKIIDKSKKICIIDDVLYGYYQRSDSYVHKFDDSYINNYIEVYSDRSQFLLNKYPKLKVCINNETALSIFVLFRMIVLAKRKDLLEDKNVLKEYKKLLKLKDKVNIKGYKNILLKILMRDRYLFYYIASILYKIKGV